MLNIIFLAIAAVLVWRFLSTGGRSMLRMMSVSEDELNRGSGGPMAGMEHEIS